MDFLVVILMDLAWRQGHDNRKNRFPVGGVMVTLFELKSDDRAWQAGSLHDGNQTPEPTLSEKLPPAISPPASCWPMVPPPTHFFFKPAMASFISLKCTSGLPESVT
jgi:hypothetical protein